MFGKRSMGIRPRDVAPRTTMAREAMRMAMPLRSARRVSHMSGLLPGGRDGPDPLFRLHEILALEDDLVLVGEPLHDLDAAGVGGAELDRHGLDDSLLDDHDGWLRLPEPHGLGRDGEG